MGLHERRRNLRDRLFSIANGAKADGGDAKDAIVLQSFKDGLSPASHQKGDGSIDGHPERGAPCGRDKPTDETGLGRVRQNGVAHTLWIRFRPGH